MQFKHYSRGTVVAYTLDDAGTVGLRYRDGRGLLRTCKGIPRPAIDRADVADVAAILACISEDLDRASCRKRGVEVEA